MWGAAVNPHLVGHIEDCACRHAETIDGVVEGGWIFQAKFVRHVVRIDAAVDRVNIGSAEISSALDSGSIAVVCEVRTLWIFVL